jgi:hypothetical protein
MAVRTRLWGPAVPDAVNLDEQWPPGSARSSVGWQVTKITLEVTDREAIAAALGAPLPAVRIEGRLRDSGKAWVLDPLRVTAGRTSASGSVGYAMGCPRSKISADLRAALLDLGELAGAGRLGPLGGARQEGEDLPRPTVSPDALRLSTSTPGRVELMLPGAPRLDRWRCGRCRERAARRTRSLTLGGGRLSGSLRLDVGRRAGFRTSVTGSDVELKALLAVLGVRAEIEGAPTDLSVALSGSGGSLHDWMTGLSGKVRVVVGPGRIEGAALNLGGDVLTQALDAVNPARKTETTTDLRCAVINVAVEGGVLRLDNRVAAETSRINLVVGGTANLGTEMLDLGFRSKATQGLGMGLANFAGAARIRGPFIRPTLGPDAEGTAVAANTVRSLFKTRGRSLLQDRVQDLLTAESPCKEALSETPPPRSWPLSLFRKQ